jgi:translation initiation factor IF-3
MRIHRHRNRAKKFEIPKFNVNEKIKAPEVRVVHNDSAEVMSTGKALELAREEGLDLIEVSPKANPPVCKIMDFGSFKYQKEKEAKKQRAAQKEVEIKGVRLSLRIGSNDLEVRRKQASKFLSKGSKVRIEMILRGREKAYRQQAQEVMDTFIDLLKEEYDIRVESPLKNAGNRIHMLIAKNS